MPRPEPIASRAVRQLTNLDLVYERLEPEALRHRLARQAPAPPADEAAGGLESRSGTIHEAVRPLSEELATTGRSAIAKLKKDKARASLSPREESALEAIVLLEGRPALLIQKGRFEDPPPEWSSLETHRAAVQAVFSRVGRIEVTGHPSLDWIGTGFLVADDVVMTNRHVAKEFSKKSGSSWSFEAGMKPRIDWAEELGSSKPLEFAVSSVIGVHEKFDMALLRVARKGGGGVKLPKPLVLPRNPAVKAGESVFVVGYPAWDGRRNEPRPMSQIFHDIYNVKRLQPGKVTKVSAAQKQFDHDCSTLGGNSGSCVLDLETAAVVGLHFQGRYRQGNQAILLWKLQGDPLLKRAKVPFT
jgi:V8-like Glu-specific endopeptidase